MPKTFEIRPRRTDPARYSVSFSAEEVAKILTDYMRTQGSVPKGPAHVYGLDPRGDIAGEGRLTLYIVEDL